MNIMAFRGSLGNYMAVMLLSVNRVSIYRGVCEWKSIKLFTLAAIRAGMLWIHTCGEAQKRSARHTLRCRREKVTPLVTQAVQDEV